MTYPYVVSTKEDICRLSEMASREDFDIYLSVGSTMFDAKSLLALFTVLGKKVNLVAPDHVKIEKLENK